MMHTKVWLSLCYGCVRNSIECKISSILNHINYISIPRISIFYIIQIKSAQVDRACETIVV